MNIKVDPSDRIARPRSKKTPTFVSLAAVMAIAGVVGLWGYNQHQEKLALQERIAEIDQQLEEQNRLEREARRKLAGTITNRTPHYDEVTSEWKQRNQQIERSPAEPAVRKQKQTDFNDQNYTPKGATNSIKPPPFRYYEPGEARTKAQVREIHQSFREGIQQMTDEILKTDQNRRGP